MTLVVGAGLCRHHATASAAVEGVLELERRYPNLAGPKLIEDELGVVGSVVVSNPSVISPNDKVGATVVLSNQSVEDGFAWTGVAHRGRIDRQDRPVFWIVIVEQDLVAA